ncbi:MAG TPA: MarR family transcriptional regulator [Candidatus Microsaccharimonas sp.]|nr:MarR family transcriptional regulator [Candidatus Microsaccharimonas sp.]
MTIPSYQSGLLFTKAHRLVRERVYTVLELYQLTPTLWSLLSMVLREPDGIRSATVAKELGVKPPMVTMMADSLIELELIQRVPHHTDGRVKLLAVTAKGKKIAKEVENKLNGEIGYLMKGLSPQDIATFQHVLVTIISNAN